MEKLKYTVIDHERETRLYLRVLAKLSADPVPCQFLLRLAILCAIDRRWTRFDFGIWSSLSALAIVKL